MSKCPVCDTELNAPICPECSFDTSRHYEAFPTFPSACALTVPSSPPEATITISQRSKTGPGSVPSPQAPATLSACARTAPSPPSVTTAAVNAMSTS